MQLECAHAVLYVRCVPRADDRNVDRGIGERPRDRELTDAVAAITGEVLELPRGAEVALERLPFEQRAVAAPIFWGERRALLHGPGQETVRERAVDEHADVMLTRVGQYVCLDVATEQVVRRLQGLDGARAGELGHLRHIEVGDADVADLSLLDERIQRLRRLRERSRRIWPVNLVEVDVVDTESIQALLDSVPQPRGRGIAHQSPPLVDAQAALRRDHHLLTPCGKVVSQGPAQQPLRSSEAICLSRVEEVDAKLAGVADRGDGRVLVERAPLT